MKIVKRIQLKIVIFTALKNCCMLHWRVFVMAELNKQGQYTPWVKNFEVKEILLVTLPNYCKLRFDECYNYILPI